jgi:hypothetical protein
LRHLLFLSQPHHIPLGVVGTDIGAVHGIILEAASVGEALPFIVEMAGIKDGVARPSPARHHHFPLFARRSLKEIDAWFDGYRATNLRSPTCGGRQVCGS